jgi:hypothetical protein
VVLLYPLTTALVSIAAIVELPLFGYKKKVLRLIMSNLASVLVSRILFIRPTIGRHGKF